MTQVGLGPYVSFTTLGLRLTTSKPGQRQEANNRKDYDVVKKTLWHATHSNASAIPGKDSTTHYNSSRTQAGDKVLAYLDQHGVEHALCGLHVLLQITVHEFEDKVQLPLALDTVLLSPATRKKAHGTGGSRNRGATSGGICRNLGFCDIGMSNGTTVVRYRSGRYCRHAIVHQCSPFTVPPL